MRTWTYAEIKEKVQNDLDLVDEDFIGDTELMGYCNEAIDVCEAEIHKMGMEDSYFLTDGTIDLVNGQSSYSLPSDIYANKIRSVLYTNGQDIYEVSRLRGQKMFGEIAVIGASGGSERYRYLLKNASAATGPQMVLYPTSRENLTSGLTLWYIRNSNRITADADVCDIPEFVSFIIQYMKVRCYEKEGHPNLQMAMAALKAQRDLMIETLTEMVPDSDNTVELDTSFYDEMV